MKYIFDWSSALKGSIIVLAIFITTCCAVNNYRSNHNIIPSNIPKTFWGKAGENPGNVTDLWKHYDWKLNAQEHETDD